MKSENPIKSTFLSSQVLGIQANISDLPRKKKKKKIDLHVHAQVKPKLN